MLEEGVAVAGGEPDPERLRRVLVEAALGQELATRDPVGAGELVDVERRGRLVRLDQPRTQVGLAALRAVPGALGEAQLDAVLVGEPLHGLEGLKHMASSIVPAIYDASLPDEIMPVTTEDGWDMSDRLAREEGLGLEEARRRVLAVPG